jgi:alpha-L-rhamnosidase
MANFQINNNIKTIRKELFLEKAEQLKTELNFHQYQTDKIVAFTKDETTFGGAKFVSETFENRSLKKGDEIIFDFGKHVVGRLHFKVKPVGSPPDAPLHLQITFGETPIEMVRDFADYKGWVSSSWLQEERMHIDLLPSEIHLSRRYAFRYVKFTVLDTSPKYQVEFEEITVEEESTADSDKLLTYNFHDEELNKIHETGVKTLKACMQSVFEDGPKRDRRLWLGDLHLQAKVNYQTYRNNDLVKRCLYLFAGLPTEEGKVSANLFIDPRILPDDTYLFDYSLFFVNTLWDYVEETADKEALEDLYTTARKQIELAYKQVNENHVLEEGDGWWAFVDWNEGINKQTACHGILMYSLKAMIKLAQVADNVADEQKFKNMYTALKEAANKYLLLETGDYISGPSQQLNLHAQLWMILGGAVEGTQATELMARWRENQAVHEISTPYMMHYYIEALITSGNKDTALSEIRRYWGGMIKEGADTFWEAYKPNEAGFSPYGDVIINSYCHAWSCTPTILLNRIFSNKTN